MPPQAQTRKFLDSSPPLSVVIASVNGGSVLSSTLDSLDVLPERDRIEVIVVETVGGSTREDLHRRARPVVVVEAERQPIPRLRYQGVMRSGAGSSRFSKTTRMSIGTGPRRS